jgi:hypothetical protein
MSQQKGLQLRTDYLVPFFHSNTRTEFRIMSADKILLSNMRLCDFGAVLGEALPTSYVRTAGVYSLIKNIYLYSGSVLIDQMRDCSKFMAIKNMKSNSADIADLNQRLLCSNNVLKPVDSPLEPELAQSVEMNENTNQLLGRVPLSQIFGLLRAVDTFNMWNDLRLVIEYNTDANQIFQVPRPENNQWSINTPLLATDELVVDVAGRDAMMKAGMNVQVIFQQVERERWYIPENQPYYSQRLRAFDTRTLSNFVIQTITSQIPHAQLGFNFSGAVLGEKINLVVNGKKLLPYQGADSAQKKLAMFQDSFGSTICFTGENDILNLEEQEVAEAYGDDALALLGELSFFGCDVMNRINTLDVEYTRAASDVGLDSLEMWAFGMVSLYLKKGADGKIVMGYV